MTSHLLVLVLAMVPAVVMAWWLPPRHVPDVLAGWTLAVLALTSPASAIWLLVASIATPLLMHLGEVTSARGMVTTLWTAILVGALIILRDWPGVLWIGGAYFTLRNLHVLFDWWMRRLENPGWRRHLRYQLFLPTLAAGPIHRIQNFERQFERRRWSAAEFFTGAERALFGLATYVVLGGKLMAEVDRPLPTLVSGWPQFPALWLQSVLDWVQLYFSFAGLSAFAIGVALMMGLKIEENFNRPWAATNLIDFWTRWHMTLSAWCRDYVFQPVTALTRAPLVGLGAAMLAIGLWHETSVYYVLWSVWQVLGIVLTRVLPTSIAALWPSSGPIRTFGCPALVLAWLSLAKPVILTLQGVFVG